MAGGMCSRCKERPTTGTSGFCVECRREYNREYRARLSPEQRKKYNYRERTPLQRRARNLWTKFRLTLQQFDVILEVEQHGLCVICMQAADEFARPLSVDHDHRTGRVRGVLCGNCNTLLGMAQDNIGVLRNAIEYLEDWAAVA